MKKESGFTLVELMVVVSITVLVLAWGIPSYSTWRTKHDIENQMVQLYSDLQFGRMTAYGRKVVGGVFWGTGASIPKSTPANPTPYYVRYDNSSPLNNSIEDTGRDVQIGATTTKYPITVVVSPVQTLNSVGFDGRGFLNTLNQATPASSITFSVSSSSGAAIDCVAVTSTRIILGKMNAGTCAPK